MKVVGLVGSPRKNGNTKVMVDEILKGASEAGAETKVFSLDEMDISPCRACMYCKGNEGECAIDDDMQIIYQELKESDAFVLGSPVYMWQMSAQSKIFTDRLYALFNTGFEENYGKKDVALAFSQGNPNENMFTNYFDHVKNVFGFLGFNVKDLLVSGGNLNPGQVKNQDDVIGKAHVIGKKLINK